MEEIELIERLPTTEENSSITPNLNESRLQNDNMPDEVNNSSSPRENENSETEQLITDTLNNRVTERDLSKVSRGMASEAKWRQMLLELFNITDSDISRVRFTNPHDDLDTIIFLALVNWMRALPVQPTRLQLYQRLNKGRKEKLCKDSESYKFLIPTNCPETIQGEIEHRNTTTGKTKRRFLPIFLINDMQNPLYLHTMLIALITKLYYASSANITSEMCYGHDTSDGFGGMYNIYFYILCIYYNVYIVSQLLRRFCFNIDTLQKHLPLGVIGMAFAILYTVIFFHYRNSPKGYVININLYFAMFASSLWLWQKSQCFSLSNIKCINLVCKTDSSVQKNDLDATLSLITWSLLGSILGKIVLKYIGSNKVTGEVVPIILVLLNLLMWFMTNMGSFSNIVTVITLFIINCMCAAGAFVLVAMIVRLIVLFTNITAYLNNATDTVLTLKTEQDYMSRIIYDAVSIVVFNLSRTIHRSSSQVRRKITFILILLVNASILSAIRYGHLSYIFSWLDDIHLLLQYPFNAFNTCEVPYVYMEGNHRNGTTHTLSTLTVNRLSGYVSLCGIPMYIQACFRNKGFYLVHIMVLGCASSSVQCQQTNPSSPPPFYNYALDPPPYIQSFKGIEISTPSFIFFSRTPSLIL